jgi:(1->4)-alpha-D-glucan 1-alpha-D-glucosylmutase
MTTPWTGTYRLQMHQGFPLSAATDILPYLKKLGISHVYLSPCLQAAPGSAHGYDVADPTKINSELGGEAAWTAFTAQARAQGLKVLLDIVPNHMSASRSNPWWEDVLTHGPYSKFSDYFDIRMREHTPYRIEICSLGKTYGQAIDAGELTLVLEDGLPRVAHFDNSWPLAPRSWDLLLQSATESVFGPATDSIRRLAALPDQQIGTTEKRAYADLTSEAHAALRAYASDGRLERSIATINEDHDQIDAILQQQYFSLHHWKLSGELSNYRRFFDVDSLIGIRTESPEVFDAGHQRIRRMIEDEEIDGLRIDHPDGLRDPAQYFKTLRSMLPEGRIYIEKILENDERLDGSWDVDGTVGYDFLSKVNRLWMDDQRIDALTGTYFDFTQQSVNISTVIRQKKRDIIDSSFSADLNRLVRSALAIARSDRSTSDISARHLHEALIALTIALPLYRTYRTRSCIDEADQRILNDTTQRARSASPHVDAAAFDFVLTLLTKPVLSDDEAAFAAEWQQLAPAVMAKGVEDTTFYCFDRLLSCNEVGASASLIGISNDKFHEYCHHLSERWPNNQLATSTHDNKRSEDVRTRISILSEIPDRWAEALHQWSQLTESSWKNRTPDRHAEYLLYQTLIGAWPITPERCWQYMLKASREAKLRTSWHEPNASYEASIKGFNDGVFDNEEFLKSLEAFIQPLILPGRINSLAQTLVKMVAPGVPDFYQGTELWDLSLVDPDNRRPVDYDERARLLERSTTLSGPEALSEWDSGLPKLWVISRLLQLRHARPDDFSPSSKYQPLVAQGSRLGNVLAFRRGENLIAAVPRLLTSVANDWADTRLPLPQGTWRHAFTNEVVAGPASASDLFGGFPVALLIRES